MAPLTDETKRRPLRASKTSTLIGGLVILAIMVRLVSWFIREGRNYEASRQTHTTLTRMAEDLYRQREGGAFDLTEYQSQKDGWNRLFRFQDFGGLPIVTSAGKDGRFDTRDDLSLWAEQDGDTVRIRVRRDTE